MVVSSSTALVVTNPISWASPWSEDRRASRSYDDSRWSNGVVYVGVAGNRTKRVYSASGLAVDDCAPLGQLIDIYV